MYNMPVRIIELFLAVVIVLVMARDAVCIDDYTYGTDYLRGGVAMSSHNDASKLGLKCFVKEGPTEMHCNLQIIGIMPLPKEAKAAVMKDGVFFRLDTLSNMSESEAKKFSKEVLKDVKDNRRLAKSRNYSKEIFQNEERKYIVLEELLNCVINNAKDLQKRLQCEEPMKKITEDMLDGLCAVYFKSLYLKFKKSDKHKWTSVTDPYISGSCSTIDIYTLEDKGGWTFTHNHVVVGPDSESCKNQTQDRITYSGYHNFVGSPAPAPVQCRSIGFSEFDKTIDDPLMRPYSEIKR